jgi:DNA-binding MarR family transcriptional regulator
MGREPSKRARADLVQRLLAAGRELSTAAVMFHTILAEKQGLSATEEKALDLLHRFGPLSAGELSKRSGLAPPSVTGLIKRLEAKGFARRIPDPEDGRRVLVAIVAEAGAAFVPLFADLVRELEDLFARYSVDQLETILGFLQEAARRQQEAAQRLARMPDHEPPRKPAS